MLIKKTTPLLAAVGIAAGLTIALGATAPVAQASTRTVCCFRITVRVSGTAYGDYQKFEMNADQGRYEYDWDGAAFGLAHLQSGILVTDRGVGVGSLVETNQVVDYAGRPKDADNTGCSQGQPVQDGSPTGEFEKTRHGFPDVGLGRSGFVDFGRPFHSWELNCDSEATDVYSELRRDGVWYAPSEFFDHHQLDPQPPFGVPLSARKLAKGGSQHEICLRVRHASQTYLRAHGISAVSIDVVHFSPDDLKRQQRHLGSFLGKSGAQQEETGTAAKLVRDWGQGKRLRENGCRKG